MSNLVKTFDKLPKIVKILLALPVIDIVWAIYRLFKSISKNNTLGIVLGIILLILCPAIFLIVDIITIILFNKVLWLD